MEASKRVKLNLISGSAAAVVLLGILFAMGGLGGCLVAGHLDRTSGAALEKYLRAYFSATQGNLASPGLGSVVWHQLRFPLAVLLFSFTTVGMICIPLVFCVRGFLFSFSIACFLRLFGWAGLVPAAVLFGLPALLWAPVLFMLGLHGMNRSYGILRHLRGEHYEQEIVPTQHWNQYLFCSLALTLCAVLEYVILPYFVSRAAALIL